jgi:hypothetical protein
MLNKIGLIDLPSVWALEEVPDLLLLLHMLRNFACSLSRVTSRRINSAL